MRHPSDFGLMRALQAILIVLCLSSCVEFNTDGPFICRNQTECGDDGKFECRRGADCYCVCAEVGTTDPQFQNNCEDQFCQNVRTQ
jgi:hypothetical protein